MTRIDRFLISSDWEDHFKGAIQMALHREFSDHWPIFLSSKEVHWGPKPFRFENSWLLSKSFLPNA